MIQGSFVSQSFKEIMNSFCNIKECREKYNSIVIRIFNIIEIRYCFFVSFLWVDIYCSCFKSRIKIYFLNRSCNEIWAFLSKNRRADVSFFFFNYNLKASSLN